MKPPPFRHVAPRTVDEAVTALAEADGHGKVLAGGQSLVPLLNMRLAAPSVLVDVNGVTGLDGIEVTDDAVVVGATVRHRDLERHAAADAALPVLRQALVHVAHPVIRNRGTVVGSLVHADPAAELPAVLVLLGGHVDVVSRDDRRSIDAEALFVAPLESSLRPDELAVSATFPRLAATTATAVRELARRHGDYAMAGVCVAVDRDDERATVTGARAVFIGVTDTPTLVDLGEDLAGQGCHDLDTVAAVARARDAIDPTDDIHATADYRRHLAGVMLARALADAATGREDA
ncbi:FAD binding domain-containing protein [Salsipaludibacter albus]|uniref:FAD binding domain-containing protein n=1 Tax=Salsipaludibacter albus TaxID=2849650 RepID=UPI001EE46F9F|nr:FAD binding domain-containing protein [Salsipaludibacter albus]